MGIPFILIAQKEKSAMVTCKLHPGQKQLHYTANTALALGLHLYRQHGNTKLAKSPE